MQARALSSHVIIALVDLATAMVRITGTGQKTMANELFHGLSLYHQRLATFLFDKRVLQHVQQALQVALESLPASRYTLPTNQLMCLHADQVAVAMETNR